MSGSQEFSTASDIVVQVKRIKGGTVLVGGAKPDRERMVGVRKQSTFLYNPGPGSNENGVAETVAEEWEASGLNSGLVIYDFRHTFATRAAADGMPLATLAAILGHSRNSLRCVMKYVHVDAGSIDAETVRMEQIRASRRLTEQAKFFAGFLPVTPSGDGEEEVKPENFSEN